MHDDGGLLVASHDRTIESVAYSPDGTDIVSGSRYKCVCIWNIESGEVIKRFMYNGCVIQLHIPHMKLILFLV